MGRANMQDKGVVLTKKEYTKAEIRSKVLLLAWPAIIEMFLMTFKQIVDTAMVGRLGEEAVAAVGLSMSPMWLFMSIFAAIGVGSTAIVARFIGAGDREGANKAGHQSLILCFGSAIMTSVLVFFCSRFIISFMGAEPQVLPLGITYIRTISLGMVFLSCVFIMSAVLRGSGDTKSPMRVNAIANIINVVLNFFLIFESRTITLGALDIFMPGAGLGVFGAALGTITAQAFGAVTILAILFKGKSVVHLQKSKIFTIDFGLIQRMVRIGIPAALERMLMSSGQIMFNRIVASLGTTAFAAHHLAIVAESISYMPGFGFAMAATTLVGQGLGAKEPELSEKCGHETTKMGTLVMSFMGLIFLIAPHTFMRFLTNEPEVIAMGIVCLRIVALAQPPFAASLIYAGALRGAGDTKFPMYATLLGVWVVRLSLAMVLGIYLQLGLLGIWLAMAIDLYLRGTLFYFRFRSGSWKTVQV